MALDKRDLHGIQLPSKGYRWPGRFGPALNGGTARPDLPSARVAIHSGAAHGKHSVSLQTVRTKPAARPQATPEIGQGTGHMKRPISRTSKVPKKTPFLIEGSICVVTGASSGLGRRFCLDLAEGGATVVGIARRSDLLKSLEAEMRESRPTSASSTIRCDVSDTDSFISAIDQVEKEHRRVDVLINCAGIGEPKETKDIDNTDEALRAYESVMDTNYFAAVAGTIRVLPGMKRRLSGVVVNVSSDSGRAPGPGEPAYCASKAALSAFTESMALAVGGWGVHLHVLYPGWVPTAMGSGAVEDGMPMPPKFVRRTEQEISRLLISKMGTPRIDIDAVKIARLAPVARSLAPSAYRKGVLASS